MTNVMSSMIFYGPQTLDGYTITCLSFQAYMIHFFIAKTYLLSSNRSKDGAEPEQGRRPQGF
jgi:hypothetical protein